MGGKAELLAIRRQQATPESICLRELGNQRPAIEKWGGMRPNVAAGAIPLSM